MKLFPYQQESLSLLLNEFKKGNKKVVLCLPTGAGKTVIFMEAARRAAIKGNTVLLLTHRIELANQARKTGQGSNIDVVMVETFMNLIKRDKDGAKAVLHKYNLVIIDEAHIGNFRKVTAQLLPLQFLIGATATPISKPPMKDQYDKIVVPISIAELIELNRLSKPTTYVSTLIPSEEFEELPQIAGEYKTDAVAKLFGTDRVLDGILDDFINRGAYKEKSIIFCASIKASEDFTKALQTRLNSIGEESTKVICIHSKMKPQARENAIDMFMHIPHYVTLVNCGIATTGFDCPDIQIVIINRATLSLALWFQMCGRGSRVILGKKSTFQIWDYGGNVQRLGNWDQRINWKQIFEDPTRGRNKIGVKVTKNCPKCAAFVPSSARKCKYCEFVFPVTVREILRGELVQMDYKDIMRLNGRMLFELSIEELAEYIIYKKYKSFYFEVVLHFSGRRDELAAYYAARGYKFAYIRMRREWLSKIKEIRNTEITL